MKTDKTLNKKSAFKNDIWMIRQIFSCTPSFAILNIFFGVLWGILDSIGIVYSKTLIDSVTNGSTFEKVLKIIIIYAIYLIISGALNNWFIHIFNTSIKEKLHIRLYTMLFKKATSLDLEKYDNPEFYNDFIWSLDETYQRAANLIEDLSRFIHRIIGSIALFAVLFSIDYLVAIVILLGSAARIVVSIFDNKLMRKISEENRPFLRKDSYIQRVHILPDYAKDLRISRVAEIFINEYRKNKSEKDSIINNYANKKTILRFLNPFIPLVAETVIYILLLYKIIVTKSLSVGSVAVAASSIWRVSFFFRDIVTRFMRFHEHGIFIEKIITFLESKTKIVSGTKRASEFENLEIKNLSFSYPNKEKGEEVYVLKNINLKIKKGEKIAIVGYNGAGKTTLTKLIMRLYESDIGEILYNGIDLKNYDIPSLRDKIAAVFQDYRIFSGTIAENVVGGVYDGDSDQKVIEALKKSVFEEKLSSLKNGINTLLTREFSDNGVELSGGEKQKIAIARAFYKNADLIILDEPSAALDPNAEYLLNKSIAEYANDKTVIFISHRLSTTRHADKIYMFDGGEIIESGTHEELIKKGGKYAYMFNLQAEKYRK